MRQSPFFPTGRRAWLTLAVAGAMVLPVTAAEKIGMPDLAQQEQTCLPTSVTNLIVWFGQHGYPKLIAPGDSAEDGYIHTVHRVMAATGANYDYGTRTDAIAYGIHKYVQEAGYDCDVEYRGLDWNQVKQDDVVKDYDADKYKEYKGKTSSSFSQDWLLQDDDPNKGYILLILYTKYDRPTNSFKDVLHAGHAITLVNAEPDLVLVHDPAHYKGESGRKILSPTVLTGGILKLPGYDAPVAGLLLLSGTALFSAEGMGGDVLLTGAVCVTMHPSLPPGTTPAPDQIGSVTTTIGGASSGSPSSPSSPASPPVSTTTSWVMWFFNLLLKK